MTVTPVLSTAATVLAHVPGLVPLGSKPSRELPKDQELERRVLTSLRGFEAAVGYPPHQAYLGALHPRDLPQRPWTGSLLEGASRFAPAGEAMPEEEFLGVLAAMDDFDLVTLASGTVERATRDLGQHPLAKHLGIDRIGKAEGDVAVAAAEEGALTLHLGDMRRAGAIRRAHDVDDALAAPVLLENLACKATATLALLHALHDGDGPGGGLDPDSIDFVLSCSEEAVGDRYQRGGGNLAKAVAEAAGLSGASGADIKNFCAAPVPAIMMAASMVAAGVFRRVAVVAGGSLPKLGMKFQGHLADGLPVLEDVLGGTAIIVEADDGVSPVVRLDAVGRHRVGAGSSNPEILRSLAVEPLETIGVNMTDVDDFATELHNPEITEPQGSGDVAARNYRAVAALAARRGEIDRGDLDAFVSERGMPGFAPTQGHLASAVCYVPHALRRLTQGQARRVLLMAKGSLFLGRMTRASDGMSIVLERNPASD